MAAITTISFDRDSDRVRVMRGSSVDASQIEVEKVCKSRDEAERYVRENTVDGINVDHDVECDYLFIDGGEGE